MSRDGIEPSSCVSKGLKESQLKVLLMLSPENVDTTHAYMRRHGDTLARA